MRTKRMLKSAKAQEAGSVIAHAHASGWTDPLIHRHGNAAIRRALRSSGVAQPQVAYGATDGDGLQLLFDAIVPKRVRTRKTLAVQTASKPVGTRKTEPVKQDIMFDTAMRYPVRFLRNGEYTFGHMMVNPARPKAVGKGMTHDIMLLGYAGEGAQVERKTLSEMALTRFLGGEITHQWLAEHSYVVTRVMEA